MISTHTKVFCTEPLLHITALEGYYKITSAINMRKMNWKFSGEVFGYNERFDRSHPAVLCDTVVNLFRQ